MSRTTDAFFVARAMPTWNCTSSKRQAMPVVDVAAALELDRAPHRGEVVLVAVKAGELRDARLEQAARLEHGPDLRDAQLGALLDEIARHVIGAHEHAAPRAGLDLDHARSSRGS